MANDGGGRLNVWIFVKNEVLNVWIFEKMALQGIVDYERTIRFLGWEMEVDLDGMNDKNVYIRIEIGSDFYPNVNKND